MNLDLVVALDDAGMFHVARAVSKPAHHRRGRTIPGGVKVTGFCVRATDVTLGVPEDLVDLADRGQGSGWCPECAGYLDHLDMARTAEASGSLVQIKSAMQMQLDEIRAAAADGNAAEMARLGQAMTGVDQADELTAWRHRRMVDTDHETARAYVFGDPLPEPYAGGQPLPEVDDELSVKRELRRLAAEGSLDG